MVYSSHGVNEERWTDSSAPTSVYSSYCCCALSWRNFHSDSSDSNVLLMVEGERKYELLSIVVGE